MGLWNPLNRAMVAWAAMCVLAACYAVAAWGQGAGDLLRSAPAEVLGPATVSVATLRVPREAWKHFALAASAAEHHRPEEFDRESAKALAIAPEFAQLYLLRATVEVDALHFEAGIESVQAALRFDPGTMWAGVVLAGAYNGMRRFSDALLVLDAQRGMESESWQAMYERARAETGARETIAALHWSALALEHAPREFPEVHLVRANALILADRLSEAAGQLTVYLEAKHPVPHRAQAMALRDAVNSRLCAKVQVREQAEVAGR